jgi:biopolymer transport protein ExbD
MAFDPKAPSKGKKHKHPMTPMPKFTPLMDMMVIMLLFLLMQFSATGDLMRRAPGVQLPASTASNPTTKEVSVILSQRGLFVETGTDREEILARPDELNDAGLLLLPGLNNFLQSHQKALAQKGKAAHKGVITIQGDRRIPYDWLLKVIQTCVRNEFTTFDFVVEQV